MAKISGFATLGPITNHDLGYDFILIQSDGSIVAIGASEDRANLEQDDVALARYLGE